MFDGLDTSVQPTLVSPETVHVWTSRIWPHLEKMTRSSKGRFLTEDIMDAFQRGAMQLWLVIRGPEVMCVCLTAGVTYPRARALRLVGLSGHQYKIWAALLKSIEHVAKQHFDCQIMEAFHPPKYRTILPGYKTTHWFGEKFL